MPWHDENPWNAKRRQTEIVERVGQVIDAYRKGDLHYRQALDEIKDIAYGTGGPVTRIGNQHAPEVQTDVDV